MIGHGSRERIRRESILRTWKRAGVHRNELVSVNVVPRIRIAPSRVLNTPLLKSSGQVGQASEGELGPYTARGGLEITTLFKYFAPVLGDKAKGI
jgi:hypothetical protein